MRIEFGALRIFSRVGHMGGVQLPQKAEIMSGDIYYMDCLRNSGADPTSYIMIRHRNIFIIIRYIGQDWPCLVRCRKLPCRLTRAWTRFGPLRRSHLAPALNTARQFWMQCGDRPPKWLTMTSDPMCGSSILIVVMRCITSSPATLAQFVAGQRR